MFGLKSEENQTNKNKTESRKTQKNNAKKKEKIEELDLIMNKMKMIKCMCEGIRHLRVTGEYMKIVLVQHPFDNVYTIQYNISGTRTQGISSVHVTHVCIKIHNFCNSCFQLNVVYFCIWKN